MKRILLAVTLLIMGCQGDRGPIGPQGLPGVDADGLEFHQFGGVVPMTGQITINVPFLRMDCPPLLTVYLETSPGNWITANILDTYEENGQTAYHMEYVIMDDGQMQINSISAVAFNHPVPFVVSMVAPVGYFNVGYQCP